MEIRNLITFVAVADCGSFTKASLKLKVSQPSVSTHIKLLEEELGTNLLKRSSKSVELTQTGRILYQDAKRIISLNNNILERINGESAFRIGASTIPATYILPEYLEHFSLNKNIDQEKTPLFIKQADSSEIIRNVTDGIIDVGFIGMECDISNISVVPVSTDRMVIIAPNAEKYLKIKDSGFSVPDLINEKFIMREDGSGSLYYLQSLFAKYNIECNKLHVIGNINSHETIKQLVASGIGIAFISELSAMDFVTSGKCISIDISSVDTTRQINMIYRSDISLSAFAQKFVDFVKKFSIDSGMQCKKFGVL